MNFSQSVSTLSAICVAGIILLLLKPINLTEQRVAKPQAGNHQPRSSPAEGCSRKDRSRAHIDKSKRISGGYEAKPGQFPSYVSFSSPPSSGKHFVSCGGTLISDRLVLTAAHCGIKAGRSRAALSIYAPSDWSSHNVTTIELDRVCNSRLFNYLMAEYDFAVVRLAEPVKLSNTTKAACLPDEPLRRGTEAHAIGLGYYDMQSSRPSRLKVLPVKRVSCRPDFMPQSTRMCTTSSEEEFDGDTCEGDSGGPILARNRDGEMCVYGITSVGQDVCALGYKGKAANADVYSSLAHIKDIIRDCSSVEENSQTEFQ